MHEIPQPEVDMRVGDTVDVYGQTRTYPGVVTAVRPPNVAELIGEGPDTRLASPGTIGKTPVVITGQMDLDVLASKLAETGSGDRDATTEKLLAQVAFGIVAQPTLDDEDLEALQYQRRERARGGFEGGYPQHSQEPDESS